MTIGVPMAPTVTMIWTPWRDWTAANTGGFASLELSRRVSSFPMYSHLLPKGSTTPSQLNSCGDGTLTPKTRSFPTASSTALNSKIPFIRCHRKMHVIETRHNNTGWRNIPSNWWVTLCAALDMLMTPQFTQMTVIAMEIACMMVCPPKFSGSEYIIKKSVFTTIMPLFRAVMQRKCLSIGRCGDAFPRKALRCLYQSDKMLTTLTQNDSEANTRMIWQHRLADPMCKGVTALCRSSSDIDA
mmetsp:Transcript_59130/g.180307  ORF Transcript_59130/g.180307 Transcript_59130/m.180307 type:complete len:242 (+) Transcript_59130:342-1067(+)